MAYDDFQPNDHVCDDEYVWRCRSVSAKGWCNVHLPTSKLGYLAWELVDGTPLPVSLEEIEKQRHKAEYDEPSEAELLSYVHHIPLEAGMKQHL